MTPLRLRPYSDFEDSIFVKCNKVAGVLEIWNKFDDNFSPRPLDFRIHSHIIDKINEETKRKYQRNGVRTILDLYDRFLRMFRRNKQPLSL